MNSNEGDSASYVDVQRNHNTNSHVSIAEGHAKLHNTMKIHDNINTESKWVLGSRTVSAYTPSLHKPSFAAHCTPPDTCSAFPPSQDPSAPVQPRGFLTSTSNDADEFDGGQYDPGPTPYSSTASNYSSCNTTMLSPEPQGSATDVESTRYAQHTQPSANPQRYHAAPEMNRRRSTPYSMNNVRKG